MKLGKFKDNYGRDIEPEVNIYEGSVGYEGYVTCELEIFETIKKSYLFFFTRIEKKSIYRKFFTIGIDLKDFTPKDLERNGILELEEHLKNELDLKIKRDMIDNLNSKNSRAYTIKMVLEN